MTTASDAPARPQTQNATIAILALLFALAFILPFLLTFGATLASAEERAPVSGEQAGDEQAASLPPILTIDGAVTAVTTFTLADLDALPQTRIETLTPWYDGRQVFTGPRLADVLAAVGARGEIVTAQALNDYLVDLPRVDAEEFGVILATRLNGKELSIRDKGPIFIVYPYDSNFDLQRDVYYTRSAWQLEKLTVK